MSRIRSVHPGLWTDEAFLSLSAFGRLLYIGLWTESYDDGVFEWKPLTLKARIFPVDNISVDELLDELLEKGCIHRLDEIGLIRNFRRWQRPKKPNSSEKLPNEWREYVGLEPLSTPPVPHQYPTSTEKPSQREDGGGRREDSLSECSNEHSSSERSPDKARKDYSKPFEDFWRSYPTSRTMAKKQAWTAWQALKPDDRVLAQSAVHAFSADFRKDNPTATMLHACRYLSQRRFDGYAGGGGPGEVVDPKLEKLDEENTRRWMAEHGEKI